MTGVLPSDHWQSQLQEACFGARCLQTSLGMREHAFLRVNMIFTSAARSLAPTCDEGAWECVVNALALTCSVIDMV